MKVGADKDPLEWMLIAKGIGIILVVVGHFHPEISPAYWSVINEVIYSFHMPLFFILSGYLYSHGKYSYSDLIRTKTKRLLYPFISIAVVFFLIKYMVGRILILEHPVDINSIYSLLLDPVNSYMPLLWFVYALFFIFAIYPLLRLILKNTYILLFLLAINVILGSDFLVIGKALANMPFFVVGVFFRENGELSKMTIRADWFYVFVPLAIFFLAYLMTRLLTNFVFVHGYIWQFFIGVVGSLFVINISHAISTFFDKKIKSMLLQIGYYSMTIYLFHTLFVSTVRMGFIQLIKNEQIPFELIAFVAITSGVVFPLVLEKKVLRKYWVINKFIFGSA